MLRIFFGYNDTMAIRHGNGNQFGGNLDQRNQELGLQERIKEMYRDTLGSSRIILFLTSVLMVQMFSSLRSHSVAQWQSDQSP